MSDLLFSLNARMKGEETFQRQCDGLSIQEKVMKVDQVRYARNGKSSIPAERPMTQHGGVPSGGKLTS